MPSPSPIASHVPSTWRRQACRAAAMLGIVAGASACSPAEEPASEIPVPKLVEVDFPGLGDCRAMIRDIDERIAAAGVGHGAYYRVPHFPYLRTDRVLASFAYEVDSIDGVGTWVRRMRELDFEARHYELRNLGLPEQEQAALRSDLFNCGRGLAFVDLDDPDNFELLRDLAQPPDESGARLPQLVDSVLRPVKRAYVAWRHREVVSRFSQGVQAAPDDVSHFLQAEETRQRALSPGHFDEALVDPLGFPGMIEAAWRAVAEVHAPRLWTSGSNGRPHLPAAPVWHGSTLQLDASEPTVFYHIGFARRGDARLVQVYYTFFFDAPERDGNGGVQSLIWRVTLDRDNQPLFYDSIPASGWPHLVFPLRGLEVREEQSWLEEPVLVPQQEGVPDEYAVLRIAGEVPRLQRVTSREAANPDQVITYRLRNYDLLYTLPHDEQGSRSLFSAHGDLMNGEAQTQWNVFTGLPERGAIRQIGRQPSRLLGPANFDDPYLPERLFTR